MRNLERYHPYFLWVKQAWSGEVGFAPAEPPGGWESFHEWLFRGKLVGFFHQKICDRGIEDRYPAPFVSELKKDRYHIYANAKLLEELAAEVCGVVAAQGLKAIPMRGIWLNRNLYKEAGLRRTTDVDLFVPPEAIPLIEAHLAPKGYHRAQPEYAPIWQEVFKKEGSPTVEAHLLLNPPDQNPPPSAEILSRARNWGESDEGLEPSDAFLELTINNAKDALLMFPGNLYDLDALARKFAQGSFWSATIERARQWRWCTALKLTLEWTRELYGTPVPDDVFRSIDPPAWRVRAARVSLAWAGPDAWIDSILPRGLGALLKMAVVEDVTPLGYLQRRKAVTTGKAQPEAA
jgi:hypothetical protein